MVCCDNGLRDPVLRLTDGAARPPWLVCQRHSRRAAGELPVAGSWLPVVRMRHSGVRNLARPREPAESAAGLPSVAEERPKWCATPRWPVCGAPASEPANGSREALGCPGVMGKNGIPLFCGAPKKFGEQQLREILTCK